MNRWIPDRKIMAAGLGATVAWLAIQAAEATLGITLTMEVATAIVGLVATGLGYLVPESAQRIIERADDLLTEYLGEDDEDPA